MDEPVFIPHEGSQIFGMLHVPEQPRDGGIGIVFCEPFAEEKLWAQRLIVNFARMLANHGYWVLRFDCRGHGDSGGEFEDSTVESRLSDVARAVAFLKERKAVRTVGLLGLRFGGTLATLAAARSNDVAFLVLWQPIVQGEKYFQECLRSNLATQMAIYKKVLNTREDMIRGLGEGKPVNIDGYLVSPAFYREVSAIDFHQGVPPFRKPVFVAQISKKEGAKPERDLLAFCESLEDIGVHADFAIIREEPFWKEIRWYFQSSEVLFSDTLSWVDRFANRSGDNGGETGNLS